MNTPKWAQELVLDVLLYASDKGLKSEIPVIKWRKPQSYFGGRRERSSGVCYKTHITLCAGSDRTDCKLVLLHELAHWILPEGEHHSPLFWDTAWDLYRRYKLPVRYCKKREANYRKGSVAAYHRAFNRQERD